MTLTPKRLKRLVTYRERLERIQEQQLATAHRAHLERENTLAAKERERDGWFAAGAPAAGPIDPQDFLAGVDYGRRLEREIGATRAALVHSANAVQAEREQLMLRRRDRRAMEVLLEHGIESERLAERRADLARLDELALRDYQPSQPHLTAEGKQS